MSQRTTGDSWAGTPAWVRRVVAGLVTIALVAGLMLTTGCSQQPPATAPSLRGVVTEVSDAGDAESARLLVVWTDDPEVGAVAEYDAASVSLSGARIWGRAPDGFTKQGPGDIRVSDIVEVWIEGPVAESYPVQAGASDVVITGRYDGELPTPRGLEPPVP